MNTKTKNNGNLITINGIEKTIQEWAMESELTPPTIRYRLKLGLTGEELISPVGVQIEYKGKTQNLKQWSKEIGVPYSKLYWRYRNGKRGDELFSTSNDKVINGNPLVKQKKTIASFIKSNTKAKRIHNIWHGMKGRCYNPSDKDFHYYGGKGIVIDEVWKNDYFAFYEWAISNGYEDDLTLMRMNRRGNYDPSNCKWATWQEQQSTRTNNIFVEIDGVTHTLSEWSRISGIGVGVLKDRLNRGLQGVDIFSAVGITLEYEGKKKTISEWSELMGIPYATLITRYYRGETDERLFRPVREKMIANTLVEIEGEKHTLKEWAEITNINYPTLQKRYKSGKRGNDLISQNAFVQKKDNPKNVYNVSITKLIKDNPKAKKIYITWKEIKKRCNYPSCKDFKYYGGKGVKLSSEWKNDFWSFHQWSIENGFTLESSLIRKDKNGHYEPNNCQWMKR